MINKLIYIGFIFGISACSVQNPYLATRSDFTAENASLFKQIDLLNNDQQDGITRSLKKVTEEVVDTNNNIHQKTVTIQEKLQLKDAVGEAEAVLVYDSANKTRSGKRLITLSDDGSGALSQIVNNFEISKYKAIQGDQFKSSLEEEAPVPNDVIKSNKAEEIPSDKMGNKSTQSKIDKKIIPSDLPDIISHNSHGQTLINPTSIHAWL